MEKSRILIDVDGVIANFVVAFMYLYEAHGGEVLNGWVWDRNKEWRWVRRNEHREDMRKGTGNRVNM